MKKKFKSWVGDLNPKKKKPKSKVIRIPNTCFAKYCYFKRGVLWCDLHKKAIPAYYPIGEKLKPKFCKAISVTIKEKA